MREQFQAARVGGVGLEHIEAFGHAREKEPRVEDPAQHDPELEIPFRADIQPEEMVHRSERHAQPQLEDSGVEDRHQEPKEETFIELPELLRLAPAHKGREGHKQVDGEQQKPVPDAEEVRRRVDVPGSVNAYPATTRARRP